MNKMIKYESKLRIWRIIDTLNSSSLKRSKRLEVLNISSLVQNQSPYQEWIKNEKVWQTTNW